MASAEDVLRDKAVAILCSRPCLDIDFIFAGMSFMGYHYSYVADLIKQRTIRIRIGDTGGFTALYDYHWDTITFSDLVNLAAPGGRATLVHEVTHAIVDLTHKGQNVDFGNNEGAAYIAQTVYELNAGDDFNKIGPMAGPLYEIASRIRNNKQGGPYQVNPADRLTVDLRGLILSSYRSMAKARGKSVPDAEIMDGINQNPMVPDP